MNQFRTGVVDTSFTLASEAGRLDALARQTRTIDAVRFDLDVAKEAVEPTDEEIRAHFDENGESYVFPERVKIDWIELDATALADDIDVTDAEAEARYEENRASYCPPRAARGVPHPADARRRNGRGRGRPDAGGRARAHPRWRGVRRRRRRALRRMSARPEAGGSLGVIAPGAMVPEFEEAVFALENEGGSVRAGQDRFRSAPDSSRCRHARVRQAVRRGARGDRRDDAVPSRPTGSFFELRGELTEIVFDESTSLEPAADTTGLDVQSSDWLDADTIGRGGSRPRQPRDPRRRQRPRGARGGQQLRADRGRTASRGRAPRDRQRGPPRPKALEDVREQVVDEIRAVESPATPADGEGDEADGAATPAMASAGGAGRRPSRRARRERARGAGERRRGHRTSPRRSSPKGCPPRRSSARGSSGSRRRSTARRRRDLRAGAPRGGRAAHRHVDARRRRPARLRAPDSPRSSRRKLAPVRRRGGRGTLTARRRRRWHRPERTRGSATFEFEALLGSLRERADVDLEP